MRSGAVVFWVAGESTPRRFVPRSGVLAAGEHRQSAWLLPTGDYALATCDGSYCISGLPGLTHILPPLMSEAAGKAVFLGCASPAFAKATAGRRGAMSAPGRAA